MSLVKQIYGKGLFVLSKVFGIDNAKKFDARFRFHRKLNLKNPKTLADKVSYIELHSQSVLASTCTDKFAVRDYIRNKGLENILVPVVGGVWNSVDEVSYDVLPTSFVLKATHGCKMNFIVTDKNNFDRAACKKEMQRWMSTTYGTYSMEPHYESIPHRIYAEEYLGDMSRLIDYKFHCINGKPEFVLAITDRVADGDKAMKVALHLFDMDWNFIPEIVGSGSEYPGDGKVPKPKCFDKMVEIAKVLSADFKFVRVDLYEKDGKVLFGELTFSPACCVFPYLSDEFITRIGEKFDLR